MATTPTLRLTSPAELLSTVPYLLGFVPAQSIVAVAVRAGGRSNRLELTLRADLPAPSDVGVCADFIAEHLAQASAAAVIYVIYPDADVEGDEFPASMETSPARYDVLADVLRRSACIAGLDVWDVLLVRRNAWRSLLCADPECCPPTGTPLDPGSPTATVAGAVAAGLSALPSREALADTLRPADAAVVAAVRVEVALLTARGWSTGRSAVASRRATTVRIVERLISARCTPIDSPVRRFTRRVPDGGQKPEQRAMGWAVRRDARALEPRLVARIVLGLGDPLAVDRCCRWALGPTGDSAVALWSEVVRRSPPPLAAAPASILSYVAWRQGLGALANIAVERALVDDPNHPLAGLMQDILGLGLDPRAGDRRSDSIE